MAFSHPNAKRALVAREGGGALESARRIKPVAEWRYQHAEPQIQADFERPADPAVERRRAIAILGLVAVGAVAALSALAYFAGPVASAIAAVAAAGLVGFGNWILDNTIDL